MSLTFDLASPAAVTLSGGGLTATNTGTTATNQGAKATSARSTGKLMWETTISTKNATPGANVGCGIATDASSYTNVGNSAAVGAIVFITTGNIWVNGSNPKSLGARAQGDIITHCVDIAAGLYWARVAPSGLWNNTVGADPATATGGLSIPTGNSYEPFVVFGGTNGTSGNAFTANFGATAFSSATPTGFSAWETNATWDPSHKAAAIVLSGGNLTATAGIGQSGVVLADTSKASGTSYFEATITVQDNSTSLIGLGLGTRSLTASNEGETGDIVYAPWKGGVYKDGINTNLAPLLGGITVSNTPTVVCVAVNFNTGNIWFRLGATGNWNGDASANPATGVGGIAFTPTTLFPFTSMSTWGAASAAQVTVADFGDTTFAGTVPSGFTAGLTAGPATSVQLDQQFVEVLTADANGGTVQLDQQAVEIVLADQGGGSIQLDQQAVEIVLADHNGGSVQLDQQFIEVIINYDAAVGITVAVAPVGIAGSERFGLASVARQDPAPIPDPFVPGGNGGWQLAGQSGPEAAEHGPAMQAARGRLYKKPPRPVWDVQRRQEIAAQQAMQNRPEAPKQKAPFRVVMDIPAEARPLGQQAAMRQSKISLSLNEQPSGEKLIAGQWKGDQDVADALGVINQLADQMLLAAQQNQEGSE